MDRAISDGPPAPPEPPGIEYRVEIGEGFGNVAMLVLFGVILWLLGCLSLFI